MVVEIDYTVANGYGNVLECPKLEVTVLFRDGEARTKRKMRSWKESQW